MEKILELELRQSEARQELADLLEKDPDNEKIGALNMEMRSLDRQIVAHKLTKPDPETRVVEGSPEAREMRELRNQAQIGDVFGAALNGKPVSGAMAEFQKETGLAGNEFSIRQLMDSERMEHRAVTPAPTNVESQQQPIIPYVFPQSVAAFLGIPQPVIASGDATFPVLTSELSVEAPAENAVTSETTGAFSAELLPPKRLQASFFFSREDRARFAGMEESLRQNLTMGLMAGLDERIISGDSDGLLHGTNLADHDAAAVTTFESYKSQLAYGRVDGRYATGVGDVRIVMGSGTYAHSATAYRANGNNADGADAALNVLMNDTSGVRVSAYVPAVASNKQNAIVRLGMAMDAISAVWSNIAIIPDEVTKASAGQIVLTAIMLYNFKLLRAAGFYKQETQHA